MECLDELYGCSLITPPDGRFPPHISLELLILIGFFREYLLTVPPYPEYSPEYEAEVSTEQEVLFLKEQASLLKEELEAVQERLEQFGKQETGDVDKDN